MNRRNEILAELIAKRLDVPSLAVIRTTTCTGGCIHRTEIIELADGRKVFVKASPNSDQMFTQEVQGLTALADADRLRVPKVIGVGTLEGNESCLILEFIDAGRKSGNFFSLLGRGLAEVHRAAQADYFGWEHDNFLGSSLQCNQRCENWIEFFAERRLRTQLRTARNNGLGSRELFKLAERVVDRLDAHLAGPMERASLLHGDLWSGNYMADREGQPVIFDPAVYYGHREAEMAMPLLFGGFPDEFFAAYHEAWPLAEGWRNRVELYQLYHLLNHLNLFGSGYLDSCIEIVRKFR